MVPIVCLLAAACVRDAAEAPSPDASADAGPSLPPPDAGPVVPRDAGACGTVSRDLGLSITPWPAVGTHGDVLQVERAPGALKLTVRVLGGAEEVYTLTGPFDDLPDEALGGRADFNVQVSGDGFIVTVGPCGWTPLTMVSGTWPELAPLIGPVEAVETGCDATSACPRDYAKQVGPELLLLPGERGETLQSFVVLGRLEGCLEDPAAPSRAEWVELPRRDAPRCPGETPVQDRSAIPLRLELRPEVDTPENRTGLAFDGEVALLREGDDLVLTPADPTATPLARAILSWPVESIPSPVAPPMMLRLARYDEGWWQQEALELRDTEGLVLAAVSAGPWWHPEWDGIDWRHEPATCLAVSGEAGEQTFPSNGHPLTLTDGASQTIWRPGDTGFDLGEWPYVLVQSAVHTWYSACSTDDPGGWIAFAFARR